MNENEPEPPEQFANERDARRSALQELAIDRLAVGLTYPQIAAEIDVSERTLCRWMSDPAFARRVSESRAQHMSVITGNLMQVATMAARTLQEAMGSERVADRLRAVQVTLANVRSFRADGELEIRLAEVEHVLQTLDVDNKDDAPIPGFPKDWPY